MVLTPHLHRHPPPHTSHINAPNTLARAQAEQQIVQSKRAVEIETLKAQAEVEPLRAVAMKLEQLHRAGPEVLDLYMRNIRLSLFEKAQQIYMEAK